MHDVHYEVEKEACIRYGLKFADNKLREMTALRLSRNPRLLKKLSSKSVKKSKTVRPAYFCNLPAEIRNMIYELIVETNLKPKRLYIPVYGSVCRCFRYELLPIIYHRTEWPMMISSPVSKDWLNVMSWLRTVGDNARLIQRFKLSTPGKGRNSGSVVIDLSMPFVLEAKPGAWIRPRASTSDVNIGRTRIIGELANLLCGDAKRLHDKKLWSADMLVLSITTFTEEYYKATEEEIERTKMTLVK